MLENNSEYRCFPCCLGEHIKRMKGTILEAVRTLKFVLARAISLVAATFAVARNWLCTPAMLAHPNEESCFWERHKEAGYCTSSRIVFVRIYIYIMQAIKIYRQPKSQTTEGYAITSDSRRVTSSILPHSIASS